MPSLIRFLVIVGCLGLAIWGGMFALATFVEPQQREMTQSIPATRFAK